MNSLQFAIWTGILVVFLIIPMIVLIKVRRIKSSIDMNDEQTRDLLKEIHRNVVDLNLRITIVETRMEERRSLVSPHFPEKRGPGRPPKKIVHEGEQ